jgi:uncharacterized membrane protein
LSPARGNLNDLRAYGNNCKVCAFKSDAQAEIDRLERAKLAEQEQRTYRAARGNLESLKSYLHDCHICADRSTAQDEINTLERLAKVFSFEICNRTSYPAVVAINGRRNPDTSDWTLQGWWNVSVGSCQQVGKFAKGYVYAMAMVSGQTLGWRGNDTRQCVSSSAFKRILVQGYNCSSAEWGEGFRAFFVNEANYTWAIEGAPLESDDFFIFQVCNNSGRFALVAVSGRPARGSGFVTEGWKSAPPGQCTPMGKYLRGYFYAMAEELGGSFLKWTAPDINLCVGRPGPFKWVNTGQTCANIESFKQFFVTKALVQWPLGPPR